MSHGVDMIQKEVPKNSFCVSIRGLFIDFTTSELILLVPSHTTLDRTSSSCRFSNMGWYEHIPWNDGRTRNLDRLDSRYHGIPMANHLICLEMRHYTDAMYLFRLALTISHFELYLSNTAWIIQMTLFSPLVALPTLVHCIGKSNFVKFLRSLWT